jgi:hypothetical protein
MTHHDGIPAVVMTSLVCDSKQYQNTPSIAQPYIGSQYLVNTSSDMPHDDSRHTSATTHNVVAHNGSQYTSAYSTVVASSKCTSPHSPTVGERRQSLVLDSGTDLKTNAERTPEINPN